MADLAMLKKLREETGAGVVDCQRALADNGGDYEKAKEQLAKLGLQKAAQKSDRAATQGWLGYYIHANGKIGSLVVLGCETDFVSRMQDFQNLARELAMQAAALKPKNVEEFLEQDYIRDPAKKVKDLLTQLSAKVGENIVVKDFQVLQV